MRRIPQNSRPRVQNIQAIQKVRAVQETRLHPAMARKKMPGMEKQKIPQRAQRKKQPKKLRQRSVPVRKSAASMKWIRTVQYAVRITRTVPM